MPTLVIWQQPEAPSRLISKKSCDGQCLHGLSQGCVCPECPAFACPAFPAALPLLSSHAPSLPDHLALLPDRAGEGDCPDQVTLTLEQCCPKAEM